MIKSRKLLDSSQPSIREVERLQNWFENLDETREVHAGDWSDLKQCSEIVAEIPSSCAARTARFSEIQKLGSGAFGFAFSVCDSDRNGDRVAIKVLRPSRMDLGDGNAKRRFEEECRVANQLTHPGIMRVHSISEWKGVPYMVTELGDLGTLATWLLDHRNELSIRQAVWLVMTLTEAVHCAHSNYTIHRDIKPANILLKSAEPNNSEGLGFSPVLSDFGLAKDLDRSESQGLTDTGELLGTVAYMSPEQIQGEKAQTYSDIFTLGVLLSELVFRVHPFADSNNFLTRRNIVLSNPKKKDRQDQRRIPKPLEEIIRKCLNKNPMDRYLSASELANDLQRFLQGKPISTSPPTIRQSISQFVSAHPIVSAVSITVLFSSLIAGMVLDRAWRLQRKLEDESAMNSQLFFDSICAANSDMNDTILSGRKVSVADLKRTLDQQILLLEDALRIAPGDRRISKQLHVMLHYASLCCLSPRDFPPEQDDLLNQAVEYRIRSLRLVEELLRQDPSNYDLQFSRLTGEHWLAGLWGQLSDDRFESMGRKALNHADELLRKRPGSLDLLEIKLGIQYNFANNLRASNPDQSQQQLERINQTVSAHLRDFTETWSVHLYGLQALVERAEILLSLHRFEESELVLEQFSQSFNRAKKLFPNEWPVHNLYRLNLQIRCALDIAMKRYDSAFEVVQELEQFIGKEGLALENLKTHPLSIDEGDLLKLVFFRWIISNQLFQKESHERQRSEQELSELLGSCITKPSVFDRVSKELKKLDLEVEFLNRASKHSPDGVE